MTIDEMFNELEDKARDTFIVTLKYKYDFEENYTIENHILEYDSIADSYVWLNDWNEGQTDVEVLGYMILGDVDTTKLLPQQTSWIPCSERLPEKNGNYLVTVEANDGTAQIKYQMVDHYGPKWLHDKKTRKVIAWMPLPESYNAESEDCK